MKTRSLWAIPLALAAVVQPAQAAPQPQPEQVGATLSQPRRFSQSLDELVRDGVLKTEDAERLRGTSHLSYEEVLEEAHRACRSMGFSAAECKKQLTIRWRALPTTAKQPTPAAKPQGSAARPAGVVLISGCVHTPFAADAAGRLVSTYSCANSDVVGYSIAVDCARYLVSLHAPRGPLGGDDTYRWGPWAAPADSHHQAAMDVACAPLFKAAGQEVR
jgi:hypothetical protein